MFGYLQVQKSELLVREWEAYQSVYCGLCKQMGRDYSFLARLSLSYDCTFYAMLLMSLRRSCEGFDNGRCTFNPLKKCRFALCGQCLQQGGGVFGDLGILQIAGRSVRQRLFKRLLVRLVKPFFSRWHKKAARNYPELETLAAQMMQAQRQTEQDSACGIDAAAHPTGDMLGSVLRLEAQDDMQERVFYEFGYQIGRWIYLMDAADDLDDDVKRGGFNPFRNYTGDDLRAYQTATLNQSLARAADAYQLITLIDFRGILTTCCALAFRQSKIAWFFGKQEEEHDESI